MNCVSVYKLSLYSDSYNMARPHEDAEIDRLDVANQCGGDAIA